MFDSRRQNRWLLWLAAALLCSVLGIFYAPSYLPRLAREEREGTEAEGLRWFYAVRAYPLEAIPPEAPMRAWEQLQQARRTQRVNATQALWTPIGPSPIEDPAGYYRDSGRINTVAVDPNNANHWLIGAATGGIWETFNGGASWAARSDDQISLAIGAIAFAPSNASIVYAGLGDPMSNQYYVGGYGVLKSTNGGTTWQLVSSPPITGTAFKRIFVDPTNPDIVVGATVGRSGNVPEILSTSKAGVYRSTNGGVTWTRTLTGSVTGLAVAPGAFSMQYARVSGDRMYRSTNGGQSWSPVTEPTFLGNRFEFAFAPSVSNTLYVGVSFGNSLIGLWRTDNAWDATPTWGTVDTSDTGGGYCGTQCGYDHIISVDPTNPNTLYGGGVSLWKCTFCSGFGNAWAQIGNHSTFAPSDTYIHYDQHSMAWAGSRLLVGTDGGLYSTTDGGMTWSSHNNGLATNQFYAGSAHPTNANILIGGMQDNGVKYRASNNYWKYLWQRGGDGFSTAIATNNPNTHWAYDFQYALIKRTTDGGNFDVDVTVGLDTSDAPFAAYFEKCPNNDDVFILGTTKVWRANDFFSSDPGLPTWSANSTTISEFGIAALAFAPNTSCNTYAVGGYGVISVTTNGGASWFNVSAGLPNRTVTSLAFDPTNSNVLYVTLSGFNKNTPGANGHIFKTTSATTGTPNWISVTTPVDLPHNAIVIDPQNTSHLYVGTDLGVWESLNGGASWRHYGPDSGLPNVAVTDLDLNRTTNRLTAFTYGRSVFMLDITTPVAMSSVSASGPAVGLTAAPTQFTAIVNTTNVATPITYTWSATNQSPVTHLSYATSDSAMFTWNITGSQTVTVTAANDNGTVSSNALNVVIKTTTSKVYLPLIVR